MMEVGTKIKDTYAAVVSCIKDGSNIPKAILTENYAISTATIKAFQDCGYQIGKDISIIGIDELPYEMQWDLKFTYVKVLFKSKAHFTIKRLLEKIALEDGSTARIIIDNWLVEGNSVLRIDG